MSTMTTEQPRLLTIKQTAAYLNATTWAVRCLLWEGRLPFIALGRNHLIDKADVDAYVTAQKQQGPMNPPEPPQLRRAREQKVAAA